MVCDLFKKQGSFWHTIEDQLGQEFKVEINVYQRDKLSHSTNLFRPETIESSIASPLKRINTWKPIESKQVKDTNDETELGSMEKSSTVIFLTEDGEEEDNDVNVEMIIAGINNPS